LTIAVIDDGLGSDTASTSPGKPSSKFGLFSIGERMRALGGTFEFSSTPGKGTTAILTLPVAPVRAESAALKPEPQVWGVNPETQSAQASLLPKHSSLRTDHSDPSPARIRVLLVDDHAMVRNGLTSVLRYNTDLQVVGEAADGLEAVALAATLRPDVVIMDVNMPKMDGVEASRRIKRDLPSTVVIGLSMHDGGQHETAMRESGAAAYLTKDAAAERLIETILRCRAASLITRASLSSST
jgi:CheY-like chemotaxis protein